jgi:hypothetical protein
LIEPKGSTYWAAWKRFMSSQLVKNEFIKRQDFSLFRIENNIDKAISYIENFYRVYHSIRYVSGLTIIRLNKELREKTLNLINHKFKDILISGKIMPSLPTKEEIQKAEYLNLPRLSMNFNLRDYGRLCEMINVINWDS